MTAVALTCSHTHREFGCLLSDLYQQQHINIHCIMLYYYSNVWMCVSSVFLSPFFKIITPYVYELLEKTCNMTRAILPVSTPSESRRLPLWFMPLKIKGSIKFENWRKCPGFRSAIMILSVVFNWKRKGDCEPSSLPIRRRSLSFYLSVSLPLPRFLLPPSSTQQPLWESVSSTN